MTYCISDGFKVVLVSIQDDDPKEAVRLAASTGEIGKSVHVTPLDQQQWVAAFRHSRSLSTSGNRI